MLLSLLPLAAAAQLAPHGTTWSMTSLVQPRDPGDQATPASAPSAWSAFSNPASATFIEGPLDLQVSYSSWSPKSADANKAVNAGLAFNCHDRFGVALGFCSDIYEPYSIVTLPSERGTSHTPSGYGIAGGFAWRPVPLLSLGAGVKYFSLSLIKGMEAYSALCGNVFVTARTGEWTFTAGADNLGYSNAVAPIPSEAVLAISYDRAFGDHAVSAAAQADVFFTGQASAGASLEYIYRGMLSAHATCRAGGCSPLCSFASLGAGVIIRGVHIDFSYLASSGPAGGSLMAGLGYRLKTIKK